MRKKNSTNSINEEAILASCGMSYTLSVLGGRWKPAILFTLLKGKLRYNELRKSIDGVSERMLVAQLRELEDDGLVKRIIYPEVPPRVEYMLTDMGRDTAPMLRHMSAWGNRHRQTKTASKTTKAAALKKEQPPGRKLLPYSACLFILFKRSYNTELQPSQFGEAAQSSDG